VFSGCGEVTPDSGELLGAFECAETAGHLQSHLDHPNILFAQVIGERNCAGSAGIGQTRVFHKHYFPVGEDEFFEA